MEFVITLLKTKKEELKDDFIGEMNLPKVMANQIMEEQLSDAIYQLTFNRYDSQTLKNENEKLRQALIKIYGILPTDGPSAEAHEIARKELNL